MTKKTWKHRFLSVLLAWAVIVTSLVGYEMPAAKAEALIKLSGVAHVQTYGDKAGQIRTIDGIETLVLGTRGQSKRVESITLNLENNTNLTGSIQYRVHRQTYGWTDWIDAGSPAGTTGQSKRLEGIQIRLTGQLGMRYDVRYRAHIQTYGDNQGWVYNGALAGTTGERKRLEEIDIQIVEKGTISEDMVPSVSYRVHRQTYGWEGTWAKNGAISGTTGQSKRLEGIEIRVNSNQYSGGIEYCTHVQSYGWLDYVSDGEMSGTTGQSKRLEAIRIRLTGDLAWEYDVWYRVHAQSYGWLTWTCNGGLSGTYGLSKRLEAIQIKLVPKGGVAPSNADCDTPYDYLDPESLSEIKTRDMLNQISKAGEKPQSEKGKQVVKYAEQFVGTPYVWGGADLRKGVDCSGFTQQVYAHFGYQLGHLVSLQYKAGREVSPSEIQPGDLLIYKKKNGDFFHVEMYYGDMKVIGADGSVAIKDMEFAWSTPDHIVRILK